MRFLRFISFFVLLAILINCSGDEPVPAGVMTAKVDGKSWRSTEPAVISDAFSEILIIAKNEDGSTISISLAGGSVRSYGLAVNSSDGLAIPTSVLGFESGGSANSHFSSAFRNTMNITSGGGVEITEVDTTHKTISGKFYSAVTRLWPSEATIQIANGSFSKISYVGSRAQMPEILPSIASAKIDNGSFVATTVGASDNLFIFSDGSQVIKLFVPISIQDGIHEIEQFNQTNPPYHLQANATIAAEVYQSISGTLTITKNNRGSRRMEGFFTFDGDGTAGSISVTDGVFGVFLPVY